MSPNKEFDLSIIIPGRNEEKRIGQTLDTLIAYLKKHDMGRVEILVVVNKTVDNTLSVAKERIKQHHALDAINLTSNLGKGYAVKVGMQKTSGAYKMFMDADLATPLHHLEEVKQYMHGGADVIIGTRNLAKIHKGLVRKFVSTFGNILVRVLLGLRINDTQCGFKAFRKEVANDIFGLQRITEWGFDMEVLAVAHKRGYSIQTIDIPDWHDVAGGSLGVGIAASLATFLDLAKIRLNLWLGRYRQK